MARPLKPLVRGGGYYPSNKWTPLVYPGGYTTANGGGQPEPEPVLKTVTGSLIHITDALALPAESLTVNVEPIQDLHGYDSPWPAGGGKNKAGPLELGSVSESKGAGTSYEGMQITSANRARVIEMIPINAQFTVSWDTTTYRVAAAYFDENGGYLGRDTGWRGWSTAAFTVTPSTGKYIALIVKRSDEANLSDADLTNCKIQLEFNSTATAYAPYENICPISGRTSATVTRTGRNLWNGTIINGRVPINLKPGVTYVASAQFVDQSVSTYFYIQRAPKGTADYTTFGQILTNLTSRTVTFTADAGYDYAFWSNSSYTNVTDVQLELGSTVSAYEPYAGNTYTITIGDTVYGGTLDVTGGKMVVDRAMVDLGTLGFAWHNGTQTFRASTISASIKAPGSNVDVANILCEMLTTVRANAVSATDCSIGVNTGGVVVAKWSTYDNDLSGFLSAVSGVMLCYELATPIEITLTPTQIEMLLGENNLWADAGDSTLTYYAEGNASTSEALGILLGGTYNNPGGADDVSDDEALGILLGGS